MKFKDGVYTRVTAIKNGVETVITPGPEIRAAWVIADEVSRSIAGINITITSILDGKHKPGSKHYTGNAFDIRTFNYSGPDISFIVEDIKKQLGKDFDVLFEIDHIHIEYDPK